MPAVVGMARSEYTALADVAAAIGRRRAEEVREMRAALVRGDPSEALRLLRVYTGLEEGDVGDESDRPTARLN